MNIVKVRYNISKDEGREYSYYSEDSLLIGDIVNVPTKNGLLKARVSAINVPESEVAPYKDALKTIPAGSLIKQEFEPAGKSMLVPDEYPGISEAIADAEPVSEESQYPEPDSDAQVEADEAAVEEEHELAQARQEEDSENYDLLGSAADLIVEVEDKMSEPEVFGEEGLPLPGGNQTAMIRVAPEKDTAVVNVYKEGLKLLEYAQGREIKSLDDLKLANNDLSIIAHLKKLIEEARKGYTGPINQHLREVNDAFKRFTEPLNMADELNRSAVKVYHREQECIQREQEEINRKRVEAAQQEMKLKNELSEPVQVVEVTQVPKRVSTEAGTTSMVDSWKYEITDIDKLPREYMMPDHSMLQSVAKNHHDKKPVPGVRFYNEPTVRVSKK